MVRIIPTILLQSPLLQSNYNAVPSILIGRDRDFMIYHITLKQQYQEALKAGFYTHGSLESEGFIHFSNREQLVETANRFFQGVEDLVLLVVDQHKVSAELKFEDVNGQSFPHLYGRLELEAITKALPLNWAGGVLEGLP